MSSSSNNNNGSNAATETMEEFRLRKDLVNFIRHEVDRNAFKIWINLGCQIVTRGEESTNSIWVMLNGRSERENSSRRDKILAVLRKAEVQWLEKDPDARIDERGMKVALRMLIPNDKVGFVIGKQREKLKIIEGENEVRAFIDNGLIADDIPIPDGFARLVLMSTKIEGIRGARADIAYLIQQAQIYRQPWVDLEMLVPFPTYKVVIGAEGENIKKIAKEFGVALAFIGDNAQEYPDGRLLCITGPTEGRVEQVREHIQQRFLDRPHQMEVLLPETVAGQMIKIRNKFGLFGYQFPRKRKIRSDGMKTVLLKGTHQAVEEARAELAQMAYDEMAKKLKKMRLTEFDRSVNGENYLKKSNFVYSSDEGENLRKKRKNVTFKHTKEAAKNGNDDGTLGYEEDEDEEGLSMDPDFIGKRIKMEKNPINKENYEEEEEDDDDDQETTYDQDEEEENSNVDYVDEEMDGTIGDSDDSTAADEGGNNQLLVAMASIQAHRHKCEMEKKEWQQSQMENRKLHGMLNVAEKQKAEMRNYIRSLEKTLLDTERTLALQLASRVGARKCDEKQKKH